MNLHDNQVQFSAPRPGHVQFSHQTNATAAAAKALGEVVIAGMEAKMQVDDELLSSRLKTAEQSGLDLIEKAKEKDADYEAYGEKALSAFVAELESAPEDVKNRFLRRNPTAVEDYTLRVDAAVALKTGNQIYNQLDKDVNRLASTVLNAPAEQKKSLYEAGLQILNNPALSSIQLDNLTYKYRNQIEEGELNTAILTNDFDTAFKMLDDVDQISTLSPVERLKYKQDINQTIAKRQEEEMKAKKEAIEEENKRKEKEIEDLEKAFDRAEKQRTRIEQAQEKAKQAAENEAKEKKETLAAYVTETYAELRRAGDFQAAETFRQDVLSGRQIKNLGSLAMFSATDVSKLESDFKSIQAYTEDPTLRAQSRVKLKGVMRPLLTKDIDGVHYNKDKMNDSIFYDLVSIKQDKEAWNNHLTEEDRLEAERLINGYADIAAESLLPSDSFPKVLQFQDPNSFYVSAPLGDISKLIEKQQNINAKVITDRKINEKAAAQRLDLVTDRYNEEHDDTIKQGTRAQALLFSTIGLASTSGTTVSDSLKMAGAVSGDNVDLVESMLLHKEALKRLGLQDSTDFTKEDVISDIAILIDLINNQGNYEITADNRNIINAIADIVMVGIKNPQKIDADDFNMEQFYPTKGQAKKRYLSDQGE